MVEERQYRRLLWLLILIGLFNALDFFATQDLVVFGEHCEWNPIMRPLVGTVYFGLYKLVAIPLGLVLLWTVRRTLVPRFLGLVRLACGVYGLLMVTLAVFYAVMMEGMCYAGCGCCMVLSLWSCVGQFL